MVLPREGEIAVAHTCRVSRPVFAFVAGLALAVPLGSIARAGNDANFVLYDHHTAKQGETEVNLYSDTASPGSDEPSYYAQLMELEHGLTDYWTVALHLEGVKVQDEDYQFGGVLLESRLRLFEYGTFLNPVLYAEYEDLTSAHRYLHAVTGRTDGIDGGGGERTLETRLILGQDLTSRFNVAFNWINETNVITGKWEFGYATGLNYVFYDAGTNSEDFAPPGGWDLEKLTLGVELYGGMGDSELGLTIDPGHTEQYLGVNLFSEWSNHLHFGVGGAFGLTKDSQNEILRLTAGYEFD